MIINRKRSGQKEEQTKSISITANGSQSVTPDTNKALSRVDITVNVPSTPSLQSKTATPTGTQFTVSPDAGYDGLSSVVVSGDANLTAANIKEDVTVYGVTGTLVESQGIADKVPEDYADYAVAAEALVLAQGGSYDSLLILENDDYIAIDFLTSTFAIQSYNTGTTEYTARGFWYAQYTKSTQTWTLTNYTSTTSTGSSYLSNGVFTNTEIVYNSETIFPLAKKSGGGVLVFNAKYGGIAALRAVTGGKSEFTTPTINSYYGGITV